LLSPFKNFEKICPVVTNRLTKIILKSIDLQNKGLLGDSSEKGLTNNICIEITWAFVDVPLVVLQAITAHLRFTKLM